MGVTIVGPQGKKVTRKTGFYQNIGTGKIYRRDVGQKRFTEVKGPIEIVRRGSTGGMPPKQTDQVRLSKELARREAERAAEIERQENIRREALERKIQQEKLKADQIKQKEILTLRDRERLRQIERRQRALNEKIKRKEVPQGFVTVTPSRSYFEITAGVLGTKKIRGKELAAKEEAALFALGFVSSVSDAVKGVRQLPELAIRIIQEPGVIKQLPAAIERSGAQFGELIRVNPTFALGKIAGDIFVLKGTGTVWRVTGKLSGSAANRLKNVRFTKLKKNKLEFSKPLDAQRPLIKIKTVAEIKKKKQRTRQKEKRKEALKDKAEIVAAGKDQLKRIKRESLRIIGRLERKYNVKLDTFETIDAQKRINNLILDRLSKRKAPITLKMIEASSKRTKAFERFFLKLKRKRKVKKVKKKKLKIKSGKIILKKIKAKKKPRKTLTDRLKEKKRIKKALERKKALKEKAEIEAIKKEGAEIRRQNIEIAANNVLTILQRKYNKKLDLFDYIDIRKKIIKNIKKELGKREPTLINLKRIKLLKPFEGPVIRIINKRVDIEKPTSIIILKRVEKTLKKKPNNQEISYGRNVLLTRKEIKPKIKRIRILKQKQKQLNVKLKKQISQQNKIQLKIKSLKSKKLSASRQKTLLRASLISLSKLKSDIAFLTKSAMKNDALLKKDIDFVSKIITKSINDFRKRQIQKKATKKSRPSVKRFKRVKVKPKVKPKPKIKKVKKKKKKAKLKQGYISRAKVKGKNVRLNKKLLSKKDAEDLLANALDKTTARSGGIKKGAKVKKLGSLKKGEKGTFKRVRKKLRTYKKKKGVKKPLTRRYIEKGKYAIDTKGEKKGLSVAKFLKKRAKKKTRKKKR